MPVLANIMDERKAGQTAGQILVDNKNVGSRIACLQNVPPHLASRVLETLCDYDPEIAKVYKEAKRICKIPRVYDRREALKLLRWPYRSHVEIIIRLIFSSIRN
jgi:hypothetical protein